MALSGNNKLVGMVGAGAAAVLVAFTSMYEGTELGVYRDPVPNVNILTVCTGETHYVVTPGDIQLGAKFTKDECAGALSRSLAEHAEPVLRCTSPAKLTPGQLIAFIDFNYNTGLFCKSTMARRAKQGEVQSSCDALLLYKLSGGRDCSLAENRRICGGVWTRRKAEHKMCTEGP